jgi:hypothetical protein
MNDDLSLMVEKSSILDHQSSITSGGIAQLVERQLCKLNVWGSNPHASTFTIDE